MWKLLGKEFVVEESVADSYGTFLYELNLENFLKLVLNDFVFVVLSRLKVPEKMDY